MSYPPRMIIELPVEQEALLIHLRELYGTVFVQIDRSGAATVLHPMHVMVREAQPKPAHLTMSAEEFNEGINTLYRSGARVTAEYGSSGDNIVKVTVNDRITYVTVTP